MIDPSSAVQRISEAIRQVTGLTADSQRKVLASLVIVLLLALLRTFTIRVNRHRVTDLRARYRWRKTITYITVVLGLLLVGRIWFSGVHDLLGYLGLVSAGVAIALRDPIVNLAGWVFISWRRPFVVGDRIAVGQHSGDVIDQRVFQFTLLEIGEWVAADQSTGRIIHIPNGKVFTEPLANYTRGFQYILERDPGAGHVRERLAQGEARSPRHRGQARGAAQRGCRASHSAGDAEVHDLLLDSDADRLHQRRRERDPADDPLSL